MEKEHKLISLCLQMLPTLRLMALHKGFPQICSSSSLHMQWGRIPSRAPRPTGKAPPSMLMGCSSSGPGKVLLEMRSRGVHQELGTDAFSLPLQSQASLPLLTRPVIPKRDAAVSITSPKYNTAPSSPPTNLHPAPPGQGAQGSSSRQGDVTAACPALLSNCSQLALTKGPFSEAVTALGGANSKADSLNLGLSQFTSSGGPSPCLSQTYSSPRGPKAW